MMNRLTKLFVEFLETEQASGIILIFCMMISLVIANSFLGNAYLDFWHTRIGFETGHPLSLNYSLEHWINEGLMVIFFLLIGLEIERELYIGELSHWKNATLPFFAALGGMAMPALIHVMINHGTETQAGMGIPMATDIAFALGVLTILGSKVPVSLKIFLTALAIIDDLGAIVIIALFYSKGLSLLYLALASVIFVGLLVLNRLRVHRLLFYLVPGLIMWYFMLKSGVHATIAGVLLAFAIPFAQGDEASPSYKLQHFLHKPVAFIIMPLFALANTGVVLGENLIENLGTSNSIGIIAGLLLGKPMGIVLFSVLAIKLGLSKLPSDLFWGHIIGAGFLGGIGFTMSIFITLLAFGDYDLIQNSKISILVGSFFAGTIGFLILKRQATPV